MNQFNLIIDQLQDQLDQLNIQEKSLIGIILGLITFILWCLLRRKRRRLKQKELADVSIASVSNPADTSTSSRHSNKSSKQEKSINNNKQKHSSNNDDGYLSDSALSFFSRFSNDGPRFRKRDKLYFYGKKMLRTVRGSITARSAEKSKNFYKILSKKFLNLKNDDSKQPMYRRTELPEFLLDIESANNRTDNDLPSALINLFRSVKVFGYFDHKIILEMCNYMETKKVYANNYLFKIGDPDDSIYVVESGRVNVYVTDEKGRKHLIKECIEGNHIFSLLSIMDVLTGDLRPYKTVSAKAVEDTTILRLPGRAFVDVLHRYPDYLVRITQIIIVRLQRVTFTALHNYLGLTSEIVRSSYFKKEKHHTRAKNEATTNTENHENSNRRNSLPNEQIKTHKTKRNQHHHHHHHHHHHYHQVKHNLNGSASEIVKNNESASDTMNHPQRKYSYPLPQVGFFAEDSDVNYISDNAPTKNKANSKEEKHSELSENMAHKKGSSTEASLENESSSYDTDGSEFGGDFNSRDLQQKLPQVQKNIAELLKLKDINYLNDKISLLRVSEGTILCKEGDYNCSLMFVLDGLLNATQKELNGEESIVFFCYPNQFCGNMSIISGEPSLFGIKAKYNTELAVITKQSFHQLVKAQPSIVLSVAHFIVKRMSPFVRQIDFALEWNLIESGNALFRQGVKAENISIVLNGRLRSILKNINNESKQLVGEFGRGDLVGLVEILMETNNATTVVAIRDTEVAQIPSGLLNYIKYRHPRVVTRLIQMLSSKLLGTIQNIPSNHYIETSYNLRQPIDAPTIASNLCTVAILPVSKDVPIHAFTMQLCHALSAIDNSLLLTKDLILSKLGPAALEKVNEYRLCAWLGQQEDHHRIVLYQCEYELTPWTRRCMRQADCLLIVGLASKEPTVGKLEKEIDNFAIRAQKELILLHPLNGSRPSNTVKWLNIRNWCSSHHHIRCSDKLLKTENNEKLIKEFEISLIKEKVDKMTDFSRLARFLTGTSIGLVLGGGGARGCAHVGLIKAMKEANIPIDMIGGTSIGSFMGALWAEENEYVKFCSRAREFSFKMKSYRKQIFDLTYPVTSMFTGDAFNSLIEEVFGKRQIEDLWIPYFCVTTDISSSKMRIHTNGTLWRYVRASMTYAWLLPPICDPFDGHLLVDGCYINNVPGSLWRYIRSSMSLSGYLPPLCDPIDGHLLLDGGYVNNLPADVMHRMGVNTVLAIDVGSKDDDNFTNYGDKLSGWWLLWKRWYPWSSAIKVPDLTEIQSRLAYVSCERGLEMVKNSDYCEYIRPPIDKYRTLQFGSFDEIKDVGYNCGKILFDTWIKHAGSIEKFLYRKAKKNMNPAFSNKNKENSPGNSSLPSSRINKQVSNKYQFDDLSQFVNLETQTQKKPADQIQKKYLKSKSVQIENDDAMFENLQKMRDNEITTKSLDKLNGDEAEEFEDFDLNSNIEDDDFNDSFEARFNKISKNPKLNIKHNESFNGTLDVSTSSPNLLDNPANTLLETVKLSGLIKNNDQFDEKLINLVQLSANLDDKTRTDTM